MLLVGVVLAVDLTSIRHVNQEVRIIIVHLSKAMILNIKHKTLNSKEPNLLYVYSVRSTVEIIMGKVNDRLGKIIINNMRLHSYYTQMLEVKPIPKTEPPPPPSTHTNLSIVSKIY